MPTVVFLYLIHQYMLKLCFIQMCHSEQPSEQAVPRVHLSDLFIGCPINYEITDRV